MAKGFVKNGAIVYIVGRRKEKLEEAATLLNDLKGDGGEVHTISADVSDRESVKELVKRLTRLDVLIHSAGVVFSDEKTSQHTPLADLQAAFLASPPETWSNTFKVNVESVYVLSASVLHLLAASDIGGRVINISSIGSIQSDPAVSIPAYQTSKTAVNHLTRILASKFRNLGIRVNAISPGYFVSQMNDPNNPESFVAKAPRLVPLRRGGKRKILLGQQSGWQGERGAILMDRS